MKTNRKTKLYEKGLRIMQREMQRLDLKSRGLRPDTKGLTPREIGDLVKLMKPLEANIKDAPQARANKKGLPSPALVKRAREILAEYDQEEEQRTSGGSSLEGSHEGHDGE